MKNMFAQAVTSTLIATWAAENIDGMFVGAENFNQNLCNWADYLIAMRSPTSIERTPMTIHLNVTMGCLRVPPVRIGPIPCTTMTIADTLCIQMSLT